MTICMEKDCNEVLNPIDHEYMFCGACKYKRAKKWMNKYYPDWNKPKPEKEKQINPADFILCLFCILELAETLPPEAIRQLPICAGKPSIFCWRKGIQELLTSG